MIQTRLFVLAQGFHAVWNRVCSTDLWNRTYSIGRVRLSLWNFHDGTSTVCNAHTVYRIGHPLNAGMVVSCHNSRLICIICAQMTHSESARCWHNLRMRKMLNGRFNCVLTVCWLCVDCDYSDFESDESWIHILPPKGLGSRVLIPD